MKSKDQQKVLNRYFTRDAKSLACQIEKHELYKQIKSLDRKQQKYHNLMRPDEDKVRQMFNDGIFNHYGNMTMTYLKKLKRKIKP